MGFICCGNRPIGLPDDDTKTGLVPQEDQGVMMVNVSTSPGNTLVETDKVLDKVENILRNTPEVEHYSERLVMD